MAESTQLIKDNQTAQGVRGGARRGAGRPSGTVTRERWWTARGINPITAGELLNRACDELAAWKRVLSSADDNVVLRGLMFLMSMRDGKPSQQINVTSRSINISASDVTSAREIATELLSQLRSPAHVAPTLDASIPKLGTGTDASNTAHSEEKASIMLSGDEGAKRVV